MPRYAFPASAKPSGLLARPLAAGDPRRYRSALEQNHPRILEAIQALWGYPELNAYFRKLTLDERGDRAGFPPEVWEELYLLLHLHQQIVPVPLFSAL